MFKHVDVIHVLQGKLEGCTVNSQGIILNHTTYYLNPDVHIFNKDPSSLNTTKTDLF